MSRGFAIKPGRWKRELKDRGIKSDAELARQIGVHKTTVGRVLKGESLAGTDFVIKVCAAWGNDIEDLFESKPRATAIRRSTVAAKPRRVRVAA